MSQPLFVFGAKDVLYTEKQVWPSNDIASWGWGGNKLVSLFGHLLFNITVVFCAEMRVGRACNIPQDGHWPASFEVIPP